MTINIKNFFNEKTKLSKMGEFQSLKQIEGLEMAAISADLYRDGRDDLALFYFSKGANYATLTTNNSITSEFIPWNNNSHKKMIKGLLVNTKNANTFTGNPSTSSWPSSAGATRRSSSTSLLHSRTRWPSKP